MSGFITLSQSTITISMKGIIVFLDILGYQSFLENNSATESALGVLEMINTLPKKLHADLSAMWLEQKFDRSITDSLSHLIFSDTIVLMLPYGADAKDVKIRASVAYASVFAARLSETMFNNGLPMRGVVHEGEFVFKDACFAGRGIVEAYRTCSKLDFAGLIVSPEISATLNSDQQQEQPFIQKGVFDKLFVSILSPLKDGTEAKQLHINWLFLATAERNAEIAEDVIQWVLRKFWAHGKDVAANVDGKIRNTCKIIRRLQIAKE